MKIKSYIPTIEKEKIKTNNKIDFIEIYDEEMTMKDYSEHFNEEPGIWIEFYRHSTDEDFNYKELVKEIYCNDISKEHYEKNAIKIRNELEKTFNVPVSFTEF